MSTPKIDPKFLNPGTVPFRDPKKMFLQYTLKHFLHCAQNSRRSRGHSLATNPAWSLKGVHGRHPAVGDCQRAHACGASQRISQLASGILVNPKIRAKKTLVFSGGPTATSGEKIDSRNGLPTENTITLKKSFPKSIKNSSHNRSWKMDTSHIGASVKKLLDLPIIIKISKIYYRISYTKNIGFEKTPFFLEMKYPPWYPALFRVVLGR